MDPVTNLTLAAALALSASLHDGLNELANENYDKAVASLSTTINAPDPTATLKPVALLFRAEAYKGMASNELAKADVLALMASTVNDTFRAQGRALFAAVGGKPEELLPKKGPSAIWREFSEAMIADEPEKALAHCTGHWRQTIEQQIEAGRVHGGNWAGDMAGMTIVGERIGRGKEQGKAWVKLSMEQQNWGWGGQAQMAVVMVHEKDRWLISGMGMDTEPGTAAEAVKDEDTETGKGTALVEEEISDETRRKVRALVELLRTGSPSERRKARKDMVEIGKAGLPVLREYVEDEDPEISETVKALVDKM